MTNYIKRVKFTGIISEFEYAKGRPTRAFLKNIVSEDGLIKKDFYWLERRPQELVKLKRGEKVTFEVKLVI